MRSVKSINGSIIVEKPVTSDKIRDFRSLKEIALILESEKIERLELGVDIQKLNKMLFTLQKLSELRKVFNSEYQQIFSKDPDFATWKKIIEHDTLEFIQMEFIKKKGYDKKLDFVKKEKLVEIVDFPDFEKLITSIQGIFEIQNEQVFKLIPFEEAFNKSLGVYPESYENKIREHCEIVLNGKSQVEKYLWMNLLFMASNAVKNFFHNPDFNQFSEAIYDRGIITTQPGPAYQSYLLNKEKLLSILKSES